MDIERKQGLILALALAALIGAQSVILHDESHQQEPTHE